jgi:hypothetical protein
MDGTRKSRTTTHLLGRRAASLVLAAGALLGASPAHADPAVDFAPGAPAYETSAQIAQARWGVNPCGGQIAIVWMSLAPSTNATSTWSNPVGQYDAPEQNTTCQVTFNKDLAWDFTRFCSILVHEYGHLAGKPHVEDHADVMYAYYEAPVAECVAAAPAQPAPAPPAIAAPPAAEPMPAVTGESSTTRAATSTPRAISSARRHKVGRLVLVRETNKRHARKHRKVRHGKRGHPRHHLRARAHRHVRAH